jgi:Zn-dependent M28 family amino/carboxypeptidase
LAVTPQLVNVPTGGPTNPTWITLDAASHDAAKTAAGGATVTFAAPITPTTRTKTWNAVGRLPGREPAGASETIVLSAHLDHVGVREAPADNPTADVIFNGADDDASGVVAVLEVAQALVEGPRPRRTIVVAFFGSEEAGGFGSRYFVNRPVVPLTNIVANLQFEMLGRPDAMVAPGTLWLTGYERSTLGPLLAEHGARLVQDPRLDQRFFERSDNIQFARRGVVAHTVSSFGLHREYHQASDELRHINFTHMRDAIASLVAPVRWLADSDVRPSWNEGLRP